MSKLSVKDLLELKGQRQFTEVYVSTVQEARACEAAGIDMIITSEKNNPKAIREAAPNTFFTIGLAYGQHPSKEAAVRGGFEALSNGADAVYAGVSFESVEAMSNEDIPVVGHVGLIPYKSTWFGGFKAVGKTAAEAMQVYQRTLDYQDAGAIAVEMELVPHKIAAEIAKRVGLLVLSMGSGTGCDGQYLFATDILGTNTGHIPRHAKVYRNFKAEYERLYQESIVAFKEFKEDVKTGAYPEKSHSIAVKEQDLAAFLASLEEA